MTPADSSASAALWTGRARTASGLVLAAFLVLHLANHALGLLGRLDGETVPTSAHRDEIVAAFTRDWCAALDAAGVPAERIVVDGPPADVVLAAAGAHAADLVVVRC